MPTFLECVQTLSPIMTSPPPIADVMIQRISNDTRAIGHGDLFVAIKGAKTDGAAFIAEAANRGAAAVVAETSPPNCTIPVILVSDTYFAYSLLASLQHGHPERRLKIIGITGTKGKTTSAYLVSHALEAAGIPNGLVSTVEYRTGAVKRKAERTTPEAMELHALLAEMTDAGLGHAVMEVSSHALAQKRFGSTRFQCAVFTNLDQDHLDYHHTMEAYFKTKQTLFTEHLDGVACVNTDDPYGIRLANELKHSDSLWRFGWGASDCAITAFNPIGAGRRCLILSTRLGLVEIETRLAGSHNALNLAGATCACLGLGLTPEAVGKALSADIAVPGRLEEVPSGNDVRVFVDYAHTAGSLRNVLRALRDESPKQLIAVFGCGGDRDRGKRPKMGAAAIELADIVIVTSDNPRSENPMDIISEILAGIPFGRKVIVEPDRRKALAMALQMASPGDFVLAAGKGHEDYQEIAGVKHPFDDRIILTEAGMSQKLR